jgi:hypothetical protein
VENRTRKRKEWYTHSKLQGRLTNRTYYRHFGSHTRECSILLYGTVYLESPPQQTCSGRILTIPATFWAQSVRSRCSISLNNNSSFSFQNPSCVLDRHEYQIIRIIYLEIYNPNCGLELQWNEGIYLNAPSLHRPVEWSSDRQAWGERSIGMNERVPCSMGPFGLAPMKKAYSRLLDSLWGWFCWFPAPARASKCDAASQGCFCRKTLRYISRTAVPCSRSLSLHISRNAPKNEWSASVDRNYVSWYVEPAIDDGRARRLYPREAKLWRYWWFFHRGRTWLDLLCYCSSKSERLQKDGNDTYCSTIAAKK